MKNPIRFTSINRLLLPLVGIVLLPAVAEAHPGHGPATGFGCGLAHPLTGLDHICAMLAVGLWMAQRGGRSIWFVPMVFVTVMAAGGMLGMAHIPIPFAEQGILASVLVLGVLIAVAVRLPMVWSALIVGLFAVFHGYAHGAEMPDTAPGLAYGFGFVTATAALNLCGIGTGLLAKRLGAETLIRFAGGGIIACGIILCLS